MLAALSTAVLIGLSLTRVSGRQAGLAWASGLLVVGMVLTSQFSSWSARHPGGRLSTFLAVHQVQAAWLLVPVAVLALVAAGALWLLSGFRLSRRLGGEVVRAGTSLSVPLLMVAVFTGFDGHQLLLRAGIGLVVLRISLGLWQASVSGGVAWRPAARLPLGHWVWRATLLLTGMGFGLLALDGLQRSWPAFLR